jgi:hypothetical protein
VVDQLARRIGHVKSVEMTHKRWYEGDYVRVRASIDVNKPLIRFAPLNMREAGRKMLLVKYEKIGFFCEVCGVLGHDMEECGDGVHNEEDIQYGNWMLAKRRANIGGVPNFRASFPGRFGGRGRGNGDPMGARKRNSGEVFADEDLEDTASSPIKPPGLADMEEDKVPEKVDHAGVARSIDFDEHDEEVNDGGEEGGAGKEEVPPPPPPHNAPIRDKKRPKKGTGEEVNQPARLTLKSWQNRRPPGRRTAGPNVYHVLELSRVGRSVDSS